MLVTVRNLPADRIIGFHLIPSPLQFMLDFIKLIDTLSRLAVQGKRRWKLHPIQLRNILKYKRLIIRLALQPNYLRVPMFAENQDFFLSIIRGLDPVL